MKNELRELALAQIEAKAQLDKWKEEEANLRYQIADLMKDEFAAGMGTTNVNLPDMKVTLVRAFNYKLNAKAFEEVEDDLSDEELACIRLKPDLDLRRYKGLEDAPVLNECIEVKEAMPTLKVKLGE